MYFSCDVGKFLDSKNGVLDVNYYDYGSLMGTEFGMDKRERILTGASGSSHAMTLMAVDLDENGNPKKWKVENSWGPASGHKGHLVMTNELLWTRNMFLQKSLSYLNKSPQCFHLGTLCLLTNCKIYG